MLPTKNIKRNIQTDIFECRVRVYGLVPYIQFSDYCDSNRDHSLCYILCGVVIARRPPIRHICCQLNTKTIIQANTGCKPTPSKLLKYISFTKQNYGSQINFKSNYDTFFQCQEMGKRKGLAYFKIKHLYKHSVILLGYN